VQEPYHTEAYNTPLIQAGHRFLSLAYRNSLPNLQPQSASSLEETESPSKFDTMKVAAKGTLQRMRVQGGGRGTKMEIEGEEEDEENTEQDDSGHTEQLLNNLTASFDQKMRLLLDPHYQAVTSPTSPSSPMDQCSKKHFDEARNLLQQARSSGRKVELRRTGRVDKRWDLGSRVANKIKENELPSVLRETQANVDMTLKRSDSLSKQEKTELNLKAKAGEKENSKSGVMALRDQFEQRALRESQGRPGKPEPVKPKKKVCDRANRGLKRRHTVGGTKDFSATVVDLLVRGAEAWDRLAPLVSDRKLVSSEVLRASGGDLGARRFSLPVEEHNVGWRYSLPGLV